MFWCHVASLSYKSPPVDLSKLLLVMKVTRFALDCVASLPHLHHHRNHWPDNRNHRNTVLRTTKGNSSNRACFSKLQCTGHMISLYLRQVYVQSIEAFPHSQATQGQVFSKETFSACCFLHSVVFWVHYIIFTHLVFV